MKWEDICSDPILQDLPYKIELNEWGQIVMTPASNKHGIFQGEIVYLLKEKMGRKGTVISECSVKTDKGIKVADVAWASPEFRSKYGSITPFEQAPEICIEILSPSNSVEEISEKMSLYFDAGAKEVWTCSDDGDISFYAETGPIDTSNIIADFPKVVRI